MGWREKCGLVFLIVAILLAPFAYRLGTGWSLMTVTFDAFGAMLYFSPRIAQRLAKSRPGATRVDLLSTKELCSFPGSRLQDDYSDSYPEIEDGD